MLSKSEIILFLDQENLPKKDVMKLLLKRVFLVKSIKDMKLVIKKLSKEMSLKLKMMNLLKIFI